MRLLDTSTFRVTQDNLIPGNQQYAILSHRWRGQEVLLQDLSRVQLPEKHKIVQACIKAREKNLRWLWVDTCCIDKTNAVETARAINSMYEWYRAATVCYAYLDDVALTGRAQGPQIFQSTDPRRAGQSSEWFERGWTLQELLASGANMEFYDRDWRMIGTKGQLARVLGQVTFINEKYLTGEARIEDASIAMRMSWMSRRTTTQVEDIAYSMLGILGVNMNIQYGEGVRAFMGLQEMLLANSTDESIFAWTSPPNGLRCYRSYSPDTQWKNWNETEWGMLAPSPDCFQNSGDVVLPPRHKIVRRPGGYRMTQQGVEFQMPMKSGTEAVNMLGLMRKEITLALNCWKPEGGKLQTFRVKVEKRGGDYMRVQLNSPLLKMDAKPSTNNVMGIDQALTRPLTIYQPPFRL